MKRINNTDKEEKLENQTTDNPENIEKTEASEKDKKTIEEKPNEEKTIEEKPNELISKIEELESKLKEYEDLLKRKVADFENFRKRTIEEKKILNQVIAEKVILDFLPIIDNLERAINAANESKDINALLSGICLVRDMFLTILLNNYNVKPIESIGKEFDHKIHNALYKKEGEYEKITVIEEVEKPYVMGDKVIRIGKVGVGIPINKKTEQNNKKDEQEENKDCK